MEGNDEEVSGNGENFSLRQQRKTQREVTMKKSMQVTMKDYLGKNKKSAEGSR